MSTIKTIKREAVRCLMDCNYSNVKGRLNNILGEDAKLFADIIIKKNEVIWSVSGDRQYLSMSDAGVEEKAVLSRLLQEKLAYVRKRIVCDKLLGEYADPILKFPSDDYIFYVMNKGVYSFVVTGWGCSSSGCLSDDSRKINEKESEEVLASSSNCVSVSQVSEVKESGNKDDVNTSTLEAADHNQNEEEMAENVDSDYPFQYLLWYRGRYGRMRYFFTILISMFIINVADYMSRGNTQNIIGGFCLCVIILCLWCNICAATKRCHDLGHSGWWQLIPFYGLWLLFAPGDEEDNQYGEAK